MITSEWDSIQIQDSFSECNNLGELIQAVEGQLSPQGEMVCEVHVNGLYLSEKDEQKFSTTNISEVRHLLIKSRSLNDLVKESTQSIFEYVPQIKLSALEAMEFFRAGEETGGQRVLSEVLDGCQWVAEALGLLKANLISTSSHEDFVDLWEDQENKYRAMVEELQGAFSSNDVILLADVLEYEVTTCLDNWLEILRKA